MFYISNMIKLILLLLIVPLLVYGQTYKVKDQYGFDTGIRIEKDENPPCSFGWFPFTVPDNQETYDLSSAVDKAIAAITFLVSIIFLILFFC